MKTIKQLTFLTVTAAAGAMADEPEITISTIDVDRDQDRVIPEGVRLERYRRNPVVLYAHDHAALPVGTTTSISVEPGRGLRARFRWLKDDPFADRVRNAFQQGVLRGASIGFLPIEVKSNELGGTDYNEVELVEWSLVAVPSNPASVRTLKALGLAPRLGLAEIAEAIRRGVGDALDPEAARLRRAVETGVRRALRENLDLRYRKLRSSARMAVTLHKAAAEGIRRALAASWRS